MYTFLVLGIIPGTDIQITFEMWLMAALVLSALVMFYIMHRRRMAIRAIRKLYQLSQQAFSRLRPQA